MCGIVTDLAGSALDASANKKNFAIQQAIFNQDQVQQGQNFDARTAAVKASDKRLLDINSSEFDANQGLQKNTYDYLLNNRAGAANDQVGYDRALSTAQTGAAAGLVTAGRQVRLDQQAQLDAERARQAGFQGAADTSAASFAGGLGQPSFDAARTAATGARDAFTTANAGPAPAQFSTDPAVQAEYAKQLSTRVGQAQATAANANGVAGYADALNTGNQGITSFRQGIDTLGLKARTSESALPAEFAVGDAQRNAATNQAGFLSAQANRQYAGDTARSSTFHDALGTAMQGFGANQLGSNEAYYGGSTDAEGAHITSVVNASKAYQDALTNLANYKMGKTTTTSPLGTTFHALYKVGQAVGQAATGAG